MWSAVKNLSRKTVSLHRELFPNISIACNVTLRNISMAKNQKAIPLLIMRDTNIEACLLCENSAFFIAGHAKGA
jgi:hypothetical protein